MLPPPIVFTWRRDEDPAYLRDREWLVTNGLGGYASGTLLGIGTRRYHGLFVPNLVEPKGRHIMISRFDEEVECGDRMVRLGGAEFLDGRLETDVPRFLEEFRVDALMPVWRYAIGHHVIEMMAADRNDDARRGFAEQRGVDRELRIALGRNRGDVGADTEAAGIEGAFGKRDRQSALGTIVRRFHATLAHQLDD